MPVAVIPELLPDKLCRHASRGAIAGGRVRKVGGNVAEVQVAGKKVGKVKSRRSSSTRTRSDKHK